MSMLRVVPRAAFARAAAPAGRRSLSSVTSWKANTEAAKAFTEAREHAYEHAAKSTDLWRKISLYALIPGAIVFGVYTFKIEAAHAKHHEHVLEENDGELPARPDYEYLNIKNKKYPWGQQTLFYNPKVNYPAPDM